MTDPTFACEQNLQGYNFATKLTDELIKRGFYEGTNFITETVY